MGSQKTELVSATSNPWLTGAFLGVAVFVVDQVFKIVCLRQLAPADQMAFLGQTILVITHIQAKVSSDIFLFFEWGIWSVVLVTLSLRSEEALVGEVVASLVFLVSYLSHVLTRNVLGCSMDCFAIQLELSKPLLTFSFGQAVMFLCAIVIASYWLRVVFAESFTQAEKAEI